MLGADGRTLVYESHGKLRAIDAGGELPDEEPEEKPATETNRRSGWLDLGRIGVQVEPRRRMGADAARSVAPAARAVLGPADVGRRLGRRCCTRYDALLPTHSHAGRTLRSDLGDAGRARHLARLRDGRRPARAAAVPARLSRCRLRAGTTRSQGLPHRRRSCAATRGTAATTRRWPSPASTCAPGDAIVAVGGNARLARPHARRAARQPSPTATSPSTSERDGATRRVLVHALRDERDAALPCLGARPIAGWCTSAPPAASATSTFPTWARGASPSFTAAT